MGGAEEWTITIAVDEEGDATVLFVVGMLWLVLRRGVGGVGGAEAIVGWYGTSRSVFLSLE